MSSGSSGHSVTEPLPSRSMWLRMSFILAWRGVIFCCRFRAGVLRNLKTYYRSFTSFRRLRNARVNFVFGRWNKICTLTEPWRLRPCVVGNYTAANDITPIVCRLHGSPPTVLSPLLQSTLGTAHNRTLELYHVPETVLARWSFSIPTCSQSNGSNRRGSRETKSTGERATKMPRTIDCWLAYQILPQRPRHDFRNRSTHARRYRTSPLP